MINEKIKWNNYYFDLLPSLNLIFFFFINVYWEILVEVSVYFD